MEKNNFIIIQPDDWHIHLREGPIAKLVIKDTYNTFGRALVMPNLKKPILKPDQAEQYRNFLKDLIPKNYNFSPIMTLYLNENITSDDIKIISSSEHFGGIKFYPKGVTTNSSKGVLNHRSFFHIFELMQKFNVTLQVHGEVNDKNVDEFDREKIFIDTVLSEIIKEFPSLRIVLEHITTKHAVRFIEQCEINVGATITPHHLLYDRNDMLSYGLKPHLYCKPILKRNSDMIALADVALSGHKKFFLGSDSAPHLVGDKQSDCGCAGVYNAYKLIDILAEFFELNNSLTAFEKFVSTNGADFYNVPYNKKKLHFEKNKSLIPNFIGNTDIKIIPMMAGENVNWTSKLIE